MHRHCKCAAMHHFDRDLLLKLSIGALSKVNLAHPSGTEAAKHPIGSYAISHHLCSMHRNRADLQTAAALAGGCSLRV